MDFDRFISKVCRLCVHCVDVLVPPRTDEALVRTLTQSKLRSIARHHARNKHAVQIPDTHTLLPYRDPHVAAVVHELKYRASSAALALVAPLIAEEILGISAEELSPPLLAPVPMHAARRKERGYNQTELLCQTVSSSLADSVVYIPQALQRVRHTTPQQKLPRAQRLKNVRGSMSADPALVRGRTVLVIDDVTTTGATFSEARRALRKAGAVRVICLALAG